MGTRFDSGREVAFCWVWAIFFGVVCLCCLSCLFCYLFLFFFVLVDTCPFLGRVSGTGVCRESILGPEILST